MKPKKFWILVSLLSIGIISVGIFWLLSKTCTTADTINTSDTSVNYSSTVEAGQVGSTILGSATNNSISVNTLAEKGMEVYINYGIKTGIYSNKTDTITSQSGEPIVTNINSLNANTEYFYQVNYKKSVDSVYTSKAEAFFFTQRSTGSKFSFGVQGDSHPERACKMFNANLYTITMQNVAKLAPDSYFAMGDDFSIEGLIDSKQQTQSAVDNIYLNQRKYLDIAGAHSSIYLINGNHEQAAKYLLDGTATSFPVLAAKARNNFYPLPSPTSFFGGDNQQVDNIGYIKDYYSFEWGDALFVTIDPYWHSDTAVDNTAGSDSTAKGQRDLWNNTLGDVQYQWFKQTLENSRAKYKFVFSHHVLGTGRGGIEEAKLYEWGGYNEKGIWEFSTKRPGWDLPIHQLMVKNGVTIFFQGHDHLFAKQTLDDVIYQEVPTPADNTYTAFNKDAYTSSVTLPNSGFLNVTVADSQVKVDYIKSFLPSDETGNNINGSVGYSYTVTK